MKTNKQDMLDLVSARFTSQYPVRDASVVSQSGKQLIKFRWENRNKLIVDKIADDAEEVSDWLKVLPEAIMLEFWGKK